MYLSWSIYQLVFVLIWLVSIFGYSLYHYKKNNDKKAAKVSSIAFAASIVIVLIMAFDVGLKQENINRTKFNQQQSELTIVKKESTRKTVEDVKQEFIKNLEN